MREKLLVALFMMMAAFFAKAAPTYRHDHSVCDFKNEKIDVDLRSQQQYASSEDDEYGDTLVLSHSGKSKTIKLAEGGLGRYRMLKASNEYCLKFLALPVKDAEMAFFLLKDNRPFADSLYVLYYNPKSQDFDIMKSKIHVKEALAADGKVYFHLASDNLTVKTGKVTINNETYTFTEKPFEPWISFDGRNFRLDREMTYQRFEHKDIIKKDMLEDLNEFKELRYQHAVNVAKKSNCLSWEGSEWVCN